MTRKSAPKLRFALVCGLLVAVTGCSGWRDTFGLTKRAPDEFAVVTKAPLTLPPNFALKPPEPGAQRPQEVQPRDTAEAALIGRRADAVTTAGSAGEAALLQQAGADQADPRIRQVINSEYTQLAERDRNFADRLIFWQKQPPPGTVIDPRAETQRLRENVATGQPVTSGETPVIERRKRGILEGIF